MSPSDDLARNRATIAGYDACAESYAAETDHAPTPDHVEALERLVASVGPGGRILEVASGPGWDADRLEAMGVQVRRTDLSEGFIAFQRERGRAVDRLDLIAGDLGGPWDGLVALYVIQHVGRELVDGVIGRIAAALRPGGTLLMSFQEGAGEEATIGSSGTYQVVRWREADMTDCLSRHGLAVDWRSFFKGKEADWITVIARRS
ncbi:bifunctional 2-polyprenyl-6-hydroxyphenol methylase/3-demethylubiquinol 3-O-methyltransferase UbiG [Brevundimonas sp.]|uniref:class I SAM-dependent methyltransferase n=1 Tax=Brevundimonas sp. TaxID=1871086 RepID=UPI00273780E3|nr:class I SAM-dependent methyltransferase [Brevundimonas sp.]MDP3800576.1 class I SAM-dependent methyltransferase [Brevundimonas sp.]